LAGHPTVARRVPYGRFWGGAHRFSRPAPPGGPCLVPACGGTARVIASQILVIRAVRRGRRITEHGRRAHASASRPQAGHPATVPTRWSRPG